MTPTSPRQAGSHWCPARSTRTARCPAARNVAMQSASISYDHGCKPKRCNANAAPPAPPNKSTHSTAQSLTSSSPPSRHQPIAPYIPPYQVRPYGRNAKRPAHGSQHLTVIPMTQHSCQSWLLTHLELCPTPSDACGHSPLYVTGKSCPYARALHLVSGYYNSHLLVTIACYAGYC